MRREVFTIGEDQTVEELIDLLLREHIHGVPVVNRAGALVGVVTQQDAFFSAATLARREGETASRAAPRLRVADLMTSPAVSATEDTDILGLCEMMHRLRIHRVPIVREGRVTGIVSSLDVCGALARGAYRPKTTRPDEA
jgi:CBS domain-containing protein